MQGPLSPEEIERTIHESAYGHLGCHAGGRTYVVPVGYAYDGHRLVCHSSEGLKVKTMRENPAVCFQIETVENLGNWRSVVLWGRFIELKGTEAAMALGLLIDRLTPFLEDLELAPHGMRSVTPPARDTNISPSVVYAIEIEEKTGRFERIAG